LPASYESDKTRRYPTLFVVPGFSGTHYPGRFEPLLPEPTRNGVDFLRVVLDPSCPLGHHVFADSANNGPVGEALVTEFLPAFDRAFRTVADPRARFLTGHSSGGWSTLWLQITYPDRFGGTWSTSPDPVDFRDFQMIDLYPSGENFYVDRAGKPRPLARIGGRVMLNFPDFAQMEDVLGPGGQLHSFEAVFSPRGRDGQPQLLWDRRTGAIQSDVARTWEKYDIRLVLERNWKALAPKLAGKIHVFMGANDTFYLEGATRLLQESLTRLGSDAVIEIDPGKNHFTLLDADLTKRIRTEMTEAFLKVFPARPAVR
jgi:S-formylglutathione hydrolase FrmB